MIHLSQTNTKGFDDLVFDHRNQAYGAYVLRREYPVNILKSLLIGIAIIASILAIPYLSDLFKKEVNEQKSTVYDGTHHLQPPTEKEKEKIVPPTVKPPKAEPPANTRIWNPPMIVTFTTDTMVTDIDLGPVNPGKTNHFGPGGFTGIEGDDDGNDSIVQITKKVYPYMMLEKKPEYVGGDEALRKFLGDNLVYPEHAKQIGLEGKVYVTFIIDEFGNVTNIAVPREIGGGLDDEAMRVMKMMPRWNPGMQAGYPVRVSYQLPIVFALN
jgi:protein TonB